MTFPTESELFNLLCHAKNAANKANHIIRKFAQSQDILNIDQKENQVDLVTQFDKECEQVIFTTLKQQFPLGDRYDYVGEESTSKDVVDPKKITFCCDPIDGTTNFSRKNWMCAVSIAVLYGGEPIVAVCTLPLINELYTAVIGHGCYRNETEKLSVSPNSSINQSIIQTNYGYDRSPKRISEINAIVGHFARLPVLGIRYLGSAVAACIAVANGSSDCFFETGIHVWDIAAGSLLVTEAGGVVMDVHGGKVDYLSRRFLCANNQTIGKIVAEQIKKVETQ